MDLLHFITQRLRFAAYFFDNASQPFLTTLDSIDNEDPPFCPTTITLAGQRQLSWPVDAPCKLLNASLYGVKHSLV